MIGPAQGDQGAGDVGWGNSGVLKFHCPNASRTALGADVIPRDDWFSDQFKLNDGMARCLKGGVIMDVINPSQAKIAEAAGAVAVMALERVPYDIRKTGGIARMTDPQLITSIKSSVSIPVMAKARIGHTVEAQVLQAIGVDFIDESEVLTPADNQFHIDKKVFKTPFVCGAATFEQAVRRINEGAVMIRTKGEAGTGNIVEAVSHARAIEEGIAKVSLMDHDQIVSYASELGVPPSILKTIAKLGRLPVVNFSAGGIATPSDAALMMQMGMDGVFVGSGIFKSSNPEAFASAIVKAVANFNDPKVIATVSSGLGTPMQSPFSNAPVESGSQYKNTLAPVPTQASHTAVPSAKGHTGGYYGATPTRRSRGLVHDDYDD